MVTLPLQSAALPLIRLPCNDGAYLLLGKCCLCNAAVLWVKSFLGGPAAQDAVDLCPCPSKLLMPHLLMQRPR